MFTEFLKELKQKSVKIVYCEGKLKYEGPESNITPELIEKLKKYKRRLIKYHWPPECANLMPINPLGSKIPFTLVYFEVMNYPLCEYLGTDQPFYGFLPHGSNGEAVNFKNVESFAAEYIVQMQKIIPSGPYFLGGFSFGGILAFEMAIQLQKAGHEVPFLALLDSMSPLVKEPFIWQNNIFKIIKSNIFGSAYRMTEHFTKLLLCQLFLLLRRPIPVVLRNFYIQNKYVVLTSKYKPGKFNGEVLLFKSETVNHSFEFNGWEPFVDKVNLVYFKGGHMTIARDMEYAEKIGKEFMNHLAKVYKPDR